MCNAGQASDTDENLTTSVEEVYGRSGPASCVRDQVGQTNSTKSSGFVYKHPCSSQPGSVGWGCEASAEQEQEMRPEADRFGAEAGCSKGARPGKSRRRHFPRSGNAAGRSEPECSYRARDEKFRRAAEKPTPALKNLLHRWQWVRAKESLRVERPGMPGVAWRIGGLRKRKWARGRSKSQRQK